MIASSVIMIRPAAFGYNIETATSNSFQQVSELSSAKIQLAALKEFEALVSKLTEHGIEVILFNDTVTPVKPDAVFPNNWFSTHADGKVFLYPMLSDLRRKERREDILERLQTRFEVKQVIDFSLFERQQKYLEGTGSMVFDHAEKIVYANLSARTHPDLLMAVAEELKYEVFTFKAADKNGNEIYHTNVLMNISDNLMVVCVDCVTHNKLPLLKRIQASKREKIFLSHYQLERFAGNMLMLQNKTGKKFMVMSETAFRSLRKSEIATIEKSATILYSPLPTIETIGGGSARCMLAENFLSPSL